MLYESFQTNRRMPFIKGLLGRLFVDHNYVVGIRKRKGQIIPALIASGEILINNSFYAIWIFLTIHFLICLTFYLGLVYPDSVGKRICHFVKQNVSVSLQKTKWKELLFKFQSLELKIVDPKMVGSTRVSKRNPANVRFGGTAGAAAATKIFATKKAWLAAKTLASAKAKAYAAGTKSTTTSTLIIAGAFVTTVQMVGIDQVVRHDVEDRYNKHVDPSYKTVPFKMKDPDYVFKPDFSS